MLTAILVLALTYLVIDKVKAILQGKDKETLSKVKKLIMRCYRKIAKGQVNG